MPSHQRIRLFLGLAIVTGAASLSAEDITITTYYPSPRGVYDELRTTNNTFLATTNGNVGIGTITPQAKLDVAGQIRITGGNPGANKVLRTDAQGLGSWVDLGSLGVVLGSGNNQMIPIWNTTSTLGDSNIKDVGGNVGISSTTPGSRLNVVEDASIGSAYVSTSAGNGLIVQGNVGIGTNAPQAALHVNGGVRIRNLAGAATEGVVVDANGALQRGAAGGFSSYYIKNSGGQIAEGAQMCCDGANDILIDGSWTQSVGFRIHWYVRQEPNCMRFYEGQDLEEVGTAQIFCARR